MSRKDAKRIGKRLGEIRRGAGFSQTAAGRRCRPRLGQQTISEIENGRGNPSLSTLSRYARALRAEVRIAEIN